MDPSWDIANIPGGEIACDRDWSNRGSPGGLKKWKSDEIHYLGPINPTDLFFEGVTLHFMGQIFQKYGSFGFWVDIFRFDFPRSTS